MVKKVNGQWRMCVDFTDLNKACPKYSYPLPNIDRLVDGAFGHTVLSFLDAFSRYNQIPMYAPDREKTAFITKQANYCYEVMPFGLKNAGVTYQRLMDKVFHNQIGRWMEVYVDDMVIRSHTHQQHLKDLEEVFQQLRHYNMRLNPSKCTFGVSVGKFLGFMLTYRGIEANPDKCRAILEMMSPTKLKDVQCLVGRLTTLSRFIPRLSNHIKPILKNMKKDVPRHWDNDCEEAFSKVKRILTSPPIMARPTEGFELQLYLAASNHSVSVALIQESPDFKMIYFTSRTLQGAEERYSQVEKVVLALLTAARRLRPYFQSHQIVVRTNHPITKILRKPDLAGRIVAWAIELSEFGLRYEPQGSVKGQHLVDFAAEVYRPGEPNMWHLNVDGSLERKGGGADIVLEGPDDLLVEQAVNFNIQLSNNQAEYEALISGLLLAKELEVDHLECRMDSQLVFGQLNGTFQVKDDHLLRYYHKVSDLIKSFTNFSVTHIPRAQNSRADLLSKLTHSCEKSQRSSVIKTTLHKPLLEAYTTKVAAPRTDWRQDIIQLMVQQEQGRRVRITDSKCIARYMFVGDDLYRRGYTTPLLKCLSDEEAKYVMQELHHGVCGLHSAKRMLRAKILRAGFYWPSMEQDCAAFVQKFGADGNQLTEEQSHVSEESPFQAVQLPDDVGVIHIGDGEQSHELTTTPSTSPPSYAFPLALEDAADMSRYFKPGGLSSSSTIEGDLLMNHPFLDPVVEDISLLDQIWRMKSFLSTSFLDPFMEDTSLQAEAANKAIISELKKRLGHAKGLWVEELPEVLWAYRCTPHGSTGETPFNLTYGTDAMLLVEVGEPTIRREMQDMNLNEDQLRVNLDTLPERRELAMRRNAAQKRLLVRRYNTKVKPRSFTAGDLVWRKRGEARKEKAYDKLSDNWEGPFRIIEDLKNGAYRLENLDGKAIPNTRNTTHLKFYYS
ncbi:uncharacterized protein LOC106780373 [Vigna radiata var. radiata]|uniref:Uncharacterized protein LOC106780373 n=1 Tax=Vigna radiata var. radiata TaxID=3916 RepID=A0A1S3W0E7_VIGRR|nr:uncharacterized protein LOC106780373 [Vigna radiata var. radiata]